MNKTAILSFILDYLLKLRNVSSNMRKRVHWMLKQKEIIVEHYNDIRALVLNGSIREGKRPINASQIRVMKKGVANYCLQTQKQLDNLVSLNNEVRCDSISFSLIHPIQVESIADLAIDQENFEIYSKCSFNKVKDLAINNLSTDQIKFILTRFKSIDQLEIYKSSLEKMDFRQSRIKEFGFFNVSFKESVYLPKEISKLELKNCKSPNLIKSQKVKEIGFFSYTNQIEDYKKLSKSLKGVTIVQSDDLLQECFNSLPSTVREIQLSQMESKLENLEEIAKHFPYLVAIQEQFPIEALDKTKLRMIHPIMSQTEEKFTLRPRKIIVTSDNAVELNNHPELFEKVESVCINTNKFNFDVLPNKIKKIDILNEINTESVTLNRLEKER